jgi:hypothetical protein
MSNPKHQEAIARSVATLKDTFDKVTYDTKMYMLEQALEKVILDLDAGVAHTANLIVLAAMCGLINDYAVDNNLSSDKPINSPRNVDAN